VGGIVAEKKTCFVVMGFGKKTDFATGRVLDLDKCYHYIIKPAAEDAGLACKRADEIVHSGTIDVPMFEQLLIADVVVADVSTSNPNAFYELGVRHALRPYTTITIAEDKMTFPFDVSHIAIRTYHHLGEDIGFGEVLRMKGELQKAIETIMSKPERDSPVYSFFTDLEPPTRKIIAEAVARTAPDAAVAVAGTTQTISMLMSQAETAIKESSFVTAKSLLAAVRTLAPNDPYVTQKLAFATYKSKIPTLLGALGEARAILCELKPEVSTDTETLGLWGSVHKRLWELTGERTNLNAAVFAYEKGFCLKNDYWNGINLAFLYDLRAASSEGNERVADRVWAERTRRRVLAICEAILAAETPDRPVPDKYWLLATMAEAWTGLKEKEQSRICMEKAMSLEPKPAAWMLESTEEQLANLANALL
jgi:hypothetical protein